MSNALPMALLRPSCAALRSSAPAKAHWSTITQAFARSFCSRSQLHTSTRSTPSILLALQHQTNQAPSHHRRTFTATSLRSAQVSDPPPTNAERVAAGALAAKKRKVPIGPLPDGPLRKTTILHIFGPNISTEDGNNILRILHHRRTSGSLVDYGVDNLGVRYAHVGKRRAEKALEWLRSKYPVDEARAAEEWAEKEANRIAYELWLADPENADSKYNDPARVFKEQQEKEQEKENAKRRALEEEEEEEERMGLLRVGKSQFEKNLKKQRQARLEAQARIAEEKEAKEREMEEKIASGEWVRTPSGTQLMKPHQTTYIDIFGREQVSRRKEMLEMYQKKAQTKFKTEEEMLEATTLKERLLPMTFLVLFTLASCYTFAHFYVPPSPEYRLFPNLSPSTATIATLIGMNILVCLCWRIAPLWPIMTKYFMHVPGYPRAIQAILNPFSHVQYEHLFSNLMFLGLAGYACHELVGRGIFMGTYIGAGAFGTLASLYWANVGKGNPSVHIVGASAAIWGISALFCLLTDAESVKIPFIKDMEVAFYPKMLFGAFVAAELWSVIKAARPGAVQGTMDHASHLGGILLGSGVAGYLRATGWSHGRRAQGATPMGEESKVVDVAAMVKEEVGEVKEGVKKAVGAAKKE